MNISVKALKVHPRNTEFFDDISGDDYEQFRDSILAEGILHKLIVAPDMTIISGHQRYKAALDLNFETVPVEVREDLLDEDAKLRVLLAANFGRKKNSDTKQRKVADEYVRLRGYGQGGDRKSKGQDGLLKLSDIAKELGTSEKSLKRMLRIERNLTDSMKDLLDTGVISKTLAADTIAALTAEEQEELIANLDVTKKITKQKVDSYIEKIKELEQKAENPVVQVIDKTDYTTIDSYKKKVKDLEAELSSLKSKEKSLEKLQKLTEAENKSLKKIQDEIRDLTQQKTNISKQLRDVRELARLSAEMQKILEDKLAPVKFMKCMDSIEANNSVKISLQKIIDHVDNWSAEMKGYLNNPDEIIVEYN